GKPQAGFCGGKALKRVWSNVVTLSIPKGERNREHKACLNTERVLPTRQIRLSGRVEDSCL
ncbi:hypothetical protein AVDCRST_MAG92-2725, partial [uncultured Coleofasciculus sp.]